jgi:hypothetical protein
MIFARLVLSEVPRENAALQAPAGERGEEGLDSVRLGAGSGRE